MKNRLFGFVLIGFALAMTHLASAQTDVGLSAYGAFNGLGKTTNISSAYLNPANAMGGMLEVRHIHSPMIGFEATYSLNRANQRYVSFFSPVSSGPVNGEFSISALSHEIAGDWVFTDSLTKSKSVQIFTVVGAGVQITVPSGGASNTQSSRTAAYLYGVGVDWQRFRHLGLRAQYRGDIHKAPQINTRFPTPNSYIHTAEPMVGVYYRF